MYSLIYPQNDALRLIITSMSVPEETEVEGVRRNSQYLAANKLGSWYWGGGQCNFRGGIQSEFNVMFPVTY